jgi:hypothetical protein
MMWDYGWHNHEGRTIDVTEALRLRDEGTLKSGDLYCCVRCVDSEHGIRLHPVDAIVRSKFLRRDPAYNENTIRPDCIKQKESREKGESWKHTRVLDAIEYMFAHETLLEQIHFSEFERLSGKDGVDFELFDEDGNSRKLIIVLRNLRRARSIKRTNPDVRILYIHRWRNADVDFVKYIRDRLIGSFNEVTDGEFSEHVKNTFAIPCLGLRPDRSRTNPLVGKGMTLKIIPDLKDQTFEAEQLRQIESLVERVQEHNMWAISTPGEHRYDTKYLSFQTFQGVGNHPEPAVDAILTALSNKLETGIKFHAYPDQTNLRREVIEAFTNTGFRTDLIERVFAEEDIDESLKSELAESITKELIDDIKNQVEEREAFQSSMNQAQKNAMNWIVNTNIEGKMSKMFEDGTLRSIGGGVMEINVDGNWYQLAEIEEGLSEYDAILGALRFTVPELVPPWSSLSEDSRKKCLKALKKFYKEATYVAGTPRVLTPLVDIKLGEYPRVLTDPYGLDSRIQRLNTERHMEGSDFAKRHEFSPLEPHEFQRLCYYLSADRIINSQDPKHPLFLDLMWAAIASTERLQRSINVKLPQPIEDLLAGQDDTGIEILDLIADALLTHPNDGE